MAMKVTKTNVHRLTVHMSCGCKMFAEFRDPRFKEPVNAPAKLEEGQDFKDFIEKNFTACEKHQTDASLSMLEFIIGERLDEAVEEANKGPVYTPDRVQSNATGSVMATSVDGGQATAQSMGMNMPNRPTGNIPTGAAPAQQPVSRSTESRLEGKKMHRSAEQIAQSAGISPQAAMLLAKNAAAAPVAPAAAGGGIELGGSLEIHDAVPEDNRVTALTELTLGFLMDGEEPGEGGE